MKMNYILPTIFGLGLSVLGGATLVKATAMAATDEGRSLLLAKGIGMAAVGGLFLVIIAIGTWKRRH